MSGVNFPGNALRTCLGGNVQLVNVPQDIEHPVAWIIEVCGIGRAQRGGIIAFVRALRSVRCPVGGEGEMLQWIAAEDDAEISEGNFLQY